MNDSGLGSFGSESADSSPVGVHAHVTGACPSERERRPSLKNESVMSLSAIYYGETVVSRRHTPVMLPWVIAEARRKGSTTGGKPVKLVVENGIVKVFRAGLEQEFSDEGLLFEHDLQAMTRFMQLSSDTRCFSYLRSLQEASFNCYVFVAADAAEVSGLSAKQL